MKTDLYKEAAEKYRPNKIKILFIAESPPSIKEDEEPRYFYFEKTQCYDFLFRCIMEVLFPSEYRLFRKNNNKKRLLNKFKEIGFFLIDACEYPIDQQRNRDFFIEKEFPKLVNRIRKLIRKNTKIMLIKKNIFELLSEPLKNKGFNVINTEYLDFPSCGNQTKFKEKLTRLLRVGMDC
jgi:hypothetical protein